jgi:hypothetical protein
MLERDHSAWVVPGTLAQSSQGAGWGPAGLGARSVSPALLAFGATFPLASSQDCRILIPRLIAWLRRLIPPPLLARQAHGSRIVAAGEPNRRLAGDPEEQSGQAHAVRSGWLSVRGSSTERRPGQLAWSRSAGRLPRRRGSATSRRSGGDERALRVVSTGASSSSVAGWRVAPVKRLACGRIPGKPPVQSGRLLASRHTDGSYRVEPAAHHPVTQWATPSSMALTISINTAIAR